MYKYFKITEKYIRRLFVFSLIFKGVLALIEVISGVAVFFIPHNAILEHVEKIAQNELAVDPSDFIANHLRLWAENFSVSAQHFAAFYLLSHGLTKLWLIRGLLENKLWYYPVSMVIFGMFAFYQLYRFTNTHSLLLLLLTSFDLLVICLIWHEYRYIRSQRG